MQKREGIESKDEIIKKFCQPKFSITTPDVGDKNDFVKPDKEISIA